MTKRIYIYSPSSAVRNKPALRRGIARLQAMGHEVEVDLAEGGGRRLLEQHVASGGERLERHGRARLGGHAERHRRRRAFGEEAAEVGEVRHPVDPRVARDPGDELELGIGPDRRDVLVAGDLAHADERHREGHSV